jgi:hypothetical protein
MGRLPHGRVVHVQVAADRAHHDLPGIQADADLNRDAARSLDLSRILLHRALHGKGCVTRPHRMILVCNGRSKERHDAIAHDLIHGAFVAVHRLYHAFEHGVEELAGFLGIAIGQ